MFFTKFASLADEIRREFKEFTDYVKINDLTAGTLTMKEAGYIAEILQTHALDTGKNVLVDGSLRDYEWYKIGTLLPCEKLVVMFHFSLLLTILLSRFSTQTREILQY